MSDFLKNNCPYIVGFILGVFTFVVVCLIWENDNLKKELNNERYGVEKLLPCPICKEEVKLEQVRDSYHIVCDKWEDGRGCNLETGYYGTKEELVKAWNGMGGSE